MSRGALKFRRAGYPSMHKNNPKTRACNTCGAPIYQPCIQTYSDRETLYPRVMVTWHSGR